MAPGTTLAPGATWAPNLTRDFMTASPTMAPTVPQSAAPTAVPSAMPSAAPSAMPSAAPSAMPSAAPSAMPSAAPSAAPSAMPSAAPSASPSAAPSAAPTVLGSTIAPSVLGPVSATMTASLELAGVFGITQEELQADLEEGMTEAISDFDDGVPRTVNVSIDDLSVPTDDSTRRTRVRGRRRLQETECVLENGDTCTVRATATVVYSPGADDDSGGSSARGVDSISNKENLQKIALAAGVEASDLTMGSLIVSADESNQVLDSSETEGVVGQNIVSSDGADASNYWLFILAAALLLLLWLCCLCWAWQRYNKSQDEQDDTYDDSTTGARWAGDKHRDSSPPFKRRGVASSDQELDTAVVEDIISQQGKRRESGSSSGGNSEQVGGGGQTLEEIPEEENSSPEGGFGDQYLSSAAAAGTGSTGKVKASGRQILSRGQQKSTGSSSFSDELVGPLGDPAGGRRSSHNQSSDHYTSDDTRQFGSSGMSSGVSGSGSNSGGVSSSFTSSAGMTSGSFEDDEEDTDDSSTSSSDYEDAHGGGGGGTTTVVDADATRRADAGAGESSSDRAPAGVTSLEETVA
ncbi:unnamed protein product [Ectocarpus sp. 12 AP-2014]